MTILQTWLDPAAGPSPSSGRVLPPLLLLKRVWTLKGQFSDQPEQTTPHVWSEQSGPNSSFEGG